MDRWMVLSWERSTEPQKVRLTVPTAYLKAFRSVGTCTAGESGVSPHLPDRRSFPKERAQTEQQ